jgi:hypothetical protein
MPYILTFPIYSLYIPYVLLLLWGSPYVYLSTADSAGERRPGCARGTGGDAPLQEAGEAGGALADKERMY